MLTIYARSGYKKNPFWSGQLREVKTSAGMYGIQRGGNMNDDLALYPLSVSA